MRRVVVAGLLVLNVTLFAAENRHAIPKEHGRLFGTIQQLQLLAAARPKPYKEMAKVARSNFDYDPVKMPSLALVAAMEHDGALAAKAIELAMKYVNGPIKVGHVTFGWDLAYCAIVYDYCYDSWTADQRAKFIEYFNKTYDANINNENYVLANPYYGYKNWGIGLACYATYYENPRAPQMLHDLEADIYARAIPALELAGDGGGWAEGYYIHYFIYEWLVFCEVARTCEGIDYYAPAPKFFRNRAVASMFEMLPGKSPSEDNAPVPDGDGGNGPGGGYSERVLAARRILASHFRAEPVAPYVNAYNQLVTNEVIPEYSYMDFLWNEPALPAANLKTFKLSHCSPGPGHVYARSSWEGDATYFFIKFTKRFNAHQHLDAGHFVIFKNAPLAWCGGYYDDFGGSHAVNYYTRSIAKNTMLILDPAEKFPTIRSNPTVANDGGQAFPWVGTPAGNNGGMIDTALWEKNAKLMSIADLVAYEDHGSFLYTAGDCTHAYAPTKLDFFTRQAVLIRPNTVVIFDRVQAKNPNFKKTWLLQTMKAPSGSAPELVETNGKAKLYIQTVLPEKVDVKLNIGKDLYRYGGGDFPPGHVEGYVPECRVEISPVTPAATDYFLNVLTATDDSAPAPPKPSVKVTGSEVVVTIGSTNVCFKTTALGGWCDAGGSRTELTTRVAVEPQPAVKSAPVATETTSSTESKTADATPAKPAAAKTAEPSAEEKGTSEKRYAELRAAIIKNATDKPQAATVELFGAATNAKVLGADESKLTISPEGVGTNFDLPWAKIAPRYFYNVARMYSDDHRALYDYCRGNNLVKEAESELLKIR
jgi:hypothetical protein